MEKRDQIKSAETKSEKPKLEFDNLAEAEQYLDWKKSVPQKVRRLVESAILEKEIKPGQTGLPLSDQFLNALGESFRQKKFTARFETDPKINNLLKPLERVETKGGYLNVFETMTNPVASWNLKKKLYETQIKIALEWLVDQDLKNLDEKVAEQSQEEGKEKKEEEQKTEDKSSDVPPVDERVSPGGNTAERKEGEPVAALFTVNPFLSGHYKQWRFNRLDPDTLEWQKPKNKFSQPTFEDHNILDARIISGKVRGKSPLSIPLRYDWTLDSDSLQTDAPEGGGEILRNQDGLWYLNINADGIFEYTIKAHKKQRVSEEIKLEKAEISGDLPSDLKEKIGELKKKNLPKLKLKREIAKLIHDSLKYATSDKLNSYYKQDPLKIFERIWQRKEANCYWTHVLGARALAEVDDEWSFISGFSVKEKDEHGNAIMHSGNGHAWLEVWDEMSGRALPLDMTPKGDPNLDSEQQEKDLEGETGEGDFGELEDELASEEEIKKKIEEMQKSQGKQEKRKITHADLEQIRFSELAECTSAQAREFLNALERVRQIKDNQGNPISDLLKDEWKKIIIERKIKSIDYRGPVRMDEGDRLEDPVSARIDIRSGEFNPSGFEKHKITEKTEMDFGGINIYFSFDLSGSMAQTDGASGRRKADVQRDGALLFVDSLMQCAYVSRQFGESPDLLPIKIMVTLASDIGETKLHLTDKWGPKEQWAMYSALNQLASGGTPTHKTLELVEVDFDKELADLKKKRVPKEKLPLHYVAEISDGAPDDFSQTESMHKDLRKKGAVVRSYTIGGKSQSKDATEPIESFSQLPQILSRDLIEKFKKLNPRRIR